MAKERTTEIPVKPGMAAVLYDSGLCATIVSEEIHGMSFRPQKIPGVYGVSGVRLERAGEVAVRYRGKGREVVVNPSSPENLGVLLEATSRVRGNLPVDLANAPDGEVHIRTRRLPKHRIEPYLDKIRQTFGENFLSCCVYSY